MGDSQASGYRRALQCALAVIFLWVVVGAPAASAESRWSKITKLPKSSGKEQTKAKQAKPEKSNGAHAESSGATSQGEGAAQAEEGAVEVSVSKEYPWDNPLQSEFSINEKTVNIFTSNTTEPVGEYLKTGWNTITIKTTPQEPATKNNQLNFQIGPMHKDPKRNRMVMSPVLWEFKNGTDWKFTEGSYSHPLGPGVKEVTLSYKVYFTDYSAENAELKAGDFVLESKGNYGNAWNSPVTATVFVNGTPLNTFLIASRQIVITSLLKQGKNEIKLVSTRVKNAIRDNDIEFQVAGPAEWNVSKGSYVVGRVVQFGAMQGWSRDAKSGMLINRAKPDAETIERVIPFFLKEGPKAAGQ